MTNSQKLRFLRVEEVLAGYRAVSQLYLYYPSVTIWRAWEYAAYKHYELSDPVLDIGCGDGKFFKLVWPNIISATGVDINSIVVERAKYQRVYRNAHTVPAHKMPFDPGSFSSAFANCSLEHMDHLPGALREIARCLCSEGEFLLSVVTDKLLQWTMLPSILEIVGEPGRAAILQSEYLSYHNYVNILSPEAWVDRLSEAGFIVQDYFPIVPEHTGRLFLLLDHLWHVRYGTGELGDLLPGIFATWPNFEVGVEQILHGFLSMESDWNTFGGAVFYARKGKEAGTKYL